MARKSSQQGLLVVVAIVVIAALALNAGLISLPAQQVTQPTQPFQQPPPEGTFYTGRVAMQVAHYDALAVTTARTEGTNVDTTWWVKRSGLYSYTGTSGDAATFDLTAADGGFVYAQVEAKSGQSYYLAKQTTLDREKIRVRGYQYFDIDNDGAKEHVFQVYCGDIQPVAGGQTSQDCYVNFAWYAYEAMTYTDPSAVTGIGTTSGTVKYLEYYTTFTNTNKASLLAELELKFNSTSTEKWKIEWVEIPGLGKISGGSFTSSQDGTNTYYKYKISYELDTAHPITYGQNELNKKEFTLKIKWSLGSGDVIQITQKLYIVTTTEGTATLTSSVNNSA